MLFKNWLIKIGIEPNEYLNIVKNIANENNYDPYLLSFSNNPKKKLNYDGVNFGANLYNDFIIYNLLDGEEIANQKRLNYRKRAYKIYKQTNNKYSPSALSYNILW